MQLRPDITTWQPAHAKHSYEFSTAQVPPFLLSMLPDILMRGVNDCSPDSRQLVMSTLKATEEEVYSKQYDSVNDSVSVHRVSA